ncbi:MAG: YncE family protein, partial [Armatimonadota bacterium]
MKKLLFPAAVVALGSVAVATVAPRLAPTTPVGEFEGNGGEAAVLPTNQTTTPAGTTVRFDLDRPKDAAWSPDGARLAVLGQRGATVLDGAGTAVAKVPFPTGPLGIAWLPTGDRIVASGKDGRVLVLRMDAGGWRKESEIVLDAVGPAGEPDVAAGTAGRGRERNDPQVAGLAVHPDGRRLYAALGIRNVVVEVDLTAGRVVRGTPVDTAPYHVALSPDGGRLAVSCRGGSVAADGELSAPSAGTRVRVDPTTDAALSGSVSFVDTNTMRVAATGLGVRQPSGIAFAADGATAWVAGSDDDTLAGFWVADGVRVRSIDLRPKADPGYGQIPTSVVLDAGGTRAWVACGGANAVVAVDLTRGRVVGRVPTGWFPIALAGRPGGLAVACTKGTGGRVRRADGAYGVHSTRGLVQLLGSAELSDRAVRDGDRQVARNNREGMRSLAARRDRAPVPVPERVGEPSVFKHVVFIVKENQTYDSMLGDLRPGNGDPRFCLFPEEV